jgi:hypothetical protein
MKGLPTQSGWIDYRGPHGFLRGGEVPRHSDGAIRDREMVEREDLDHEGLHVGSVVSVPPLEYAD